MTAELVRFGIEDIDVLLKGGVPPGSVINLTGPPGSGKTLISLSFISEGFRNDDQGVQVCFSTVPISNILKQTQDSRRYEPLFKTDDPVVMDLSDLDRVDILIGLIEDGGIDRLVLDHPEIMSLRGSGEWFRMLEELLISARSNKVTTVIVDYNGDSPAGAGKYLADGIITIERSGTLRKARIVKWDLDPALVNKEAVEEVAGDWTN